MKYIVLVPTLVALTAFPADRSQDPAGGHPAPRAAAQTISCTHRPTTPLWLVVDGPAEVQPGTTITVRVSVTRKAISALPMKLSINLPTGATLAEGLAAESITDATSPVIERTYRVVVGSVPASDISFELLQGTGGLVTRAEGYYRFGRADPRIAVPQFGESLVINNVKMVSPVIATPK